MIRVAVDWTKISPAEKAIYDTWVKVAMKEIGSVIDEWEENYPPTPEKLLDAKIWTKYKEWLLKNVFHFKCAYCEKSVKDQKNDAEHFRPKGSVRVEAASSKWEKVEVQLPDGTKAPHPGYFWLAYDPENLMPACDACNSSNETGGAAKLDKFPVSNQHLVAVKLSAAEAASMNPPPWPSKKWKGYYYLRPAELDAREGRLLVHPMKEDPKQHLMFLPGGAVESKKTPQGDASIKVLTLFRDELNRQRQMQQKAIWSTVLAIWGLDFNVATLFPRVKPNIQLFLDGEEAFSAAALDFIVKQVNHPDFQKAVEEARK